MANGYAGWREVPTTAADGEWQRDYEIDGEAYTGVVARYNTARANKRFVAIMRYPDGNTMRLDAKATLGGAQRVCARHIKIRRGMQK